MLKLVRAIGQILAFAVFAIVVAYFSASPVYTHLADDLALIRLNFTHAGHPIQECRRYTQAELDQLAPNMRRTMDCPRGRVPLFVELIVDGKTEYQESVAPTGLANDGATTVYKRLPVGAGSHDIEVRMRDSRRDQGFDFLHKESVNLEAGDNLVIDFEAETGGFRIL